MSDCNTPYNNACRKDIPYPSVSNESVPSLIDNLVYALYGTITKSVINRRVVWNIPCDPNSTAQITNLPRNAGEGLLCYIIRSFDYLLNDATIVTTNGVQTLTNKTLVSPTITGTGSIEGTFTGNVSGVSTKAVNLTGATAGTIPYQSASETTSYIANGINGQKLISAGAGAPFWSNDSKGVTDASNAEAGNVGEAIRSSVIEANAITLTTAVVSNVTSITLTAGDWDVSGIVSFLLANASSTFSSTGFIGGINTASAALGNADTYFNYPVDLTTKSGIISFPTSVVRINVSANATAHLVARATFSTANPSVKAFGRISARRIR